MKLVEPFNLFMKQRVNLSDDRIERLDGHVSAVRDFLARGEGDIGSNFIDLVAQGSYAHRTIINPVGSADDFDADVLLEMNEVEDWEASEYVEALYRRFRESGTYKEKVRRRTRCLVVDYAGDFHMDVVPYLTRGNDTYITNKSENVFERTNPEGFNAWLDGQNRVTGGRLVKVIRLAKFLRDLKNTFSIPSVIFSILLGERVTSGALWADPDHYKDLPTALVNLFEDLDDYLVSNPTMPNIEDPSCAGETFNHRWDQVLYANFASWIHTYSLWMRDALDEANRDKSYQKWRRVFGDDFGTYVANSGERTGTSLLALSTSLDTNEEIERRWGFPIHLQTAYSVKLVGRVRRSGIVRSYDLPKRGNVVRKRQTIDFSLAHCTVPEPYAIYWKVRNSGSEAESAKQLRGQIERDGGSQTRYETTSYFGRHFVEVFIVKDKQVVARDRQLVIVKQ